MQIRPARIIILSFVSLIALGTLLIYLPWATEQGITLLDALFMSASAVCVTGLVVKDLAVNFTVFGQTVILALFQLGGLGIMTLSTIFALMLGRRITITNRKMLALTFEGIELDIKLLLKWIFVSTLLIELTGTLLLKHFIPGLSMFSAIFHAVSGFCNAGFSLFSDSFISMHTHLAVNFIMIVLILTGGVGFLVLFDLSRWCKAKLFKKDLRLTLHSKIVIVTTVILIFTWTIFLFVTEQNQVLQSYSLGNKWLAACFQSVTARTAGLNTIEIANLQASSKLFLGTLMFIGASPGSTGGGIKTVTLALLILGVLTLLKGGEQIKIGNRAIPIYLFEKAVVIVMLSLIWVIAAMTILFIIERHQPLDLIFEVISAFGTVGLSCGITDSLTPPGKFIIILTMLFGRIGPMTLAIALANKEDANFKLPEEGVMVG
ncbi:MAG: potassium transporter TrkG [Candidatus Omnitrophica bacterium]|nr:potassium transporter TrkG [Candidatus Omnitrophota bacterium]